MLLMVVFRAIQLPTGYKFESVVLTTRCVSQDPFKIAILDQHPADIAKGSF